MVLTPEMVSKNVISFLEWLNYRTECELQDILEKIIEEKERQIEKLRNFSSQKEDIICYAEFLEMDMYGIVSKYIENRTRYLP